MLTDRSRKWIRCHLRASDFVSAWSQLVSNLTDKLVLLDSVLVKPAETPGEVPAQGHGKDVD